MSWRSRLAAIFGFGRKALPAPGVDAGTVALVDAYTSLTWREREYMIGRLRDQALGIQRRPQVVNARWQPRDRDLILAECEQGQFMRLAIFLDSMRSDGLIYGLMGTRTAGMLRRPVMFSGDPFLCAQLKGVDPEVDECGNVIAPGCPGVFARMCPTSEAANVIWDGILGNLGLGELVPGPDGLPVLRHLDLHWLRYEYGTDRLIYQAPGGTYEVRPGDGRWVVFTPKGAQRFWMNGSWYPLALPFISNAGTALDRLRWQGQLADPLKAIETTDKTTERQRTGLLRFILDKWHRSPGFVGRPGEKAYLVESNNLGWEVYNSADDRADSRIQYILSGQVVTGEGNKGFSSGDIFEAIKDAIIQETAETWAECVQRDIIAPWALRFWGVRDERAVTVAWDVESPTARKARLDALGAAVDVIAKADAALASRGLEVDLDALEKEQRIVLPTRPRGQAPGAPALPSAPPGPALLPSATPVQGDDDGPQEPDDAARLAEKMTANKWARCEHGSSNRCRKCGIERVRDAELGPDGQPVWLVKWKTIAPAQVGGAA